MLVWPEESRGKISQISSFDDEEKGQGRDDEADQAVGEDASVRGHGTGFLCSRQRGVSGADHDAHRHVEHVTLGGEFLELLQHGRTSV